MRGDDVLGARADRESRVHLAKSRRRVASRAGQGARGGSGPERQRARAATSGRTAVAASLTQFAERLQGTSEEALGEAVLRLQLVEGIRPEVMTHLMFLFTMNDPSEFVKDDLTAYVGPIKQVAMTLRVNAHQDFIRTAYEKALADDA